MRRHLSASLIFGFISVGVFSLPVWAADTLNAAPAGIVATAATLDQVMDAHDKAVHVDKKWATDIEEGTVSMNGLKGTYRDVFSGDDYRHTMNLTPLSWQEGSVNGTRWFQNENGVVTMLHNVHRQDQVDAEALLRP